MVLFRSLIKLDSLRTKVVLSFAVIIVVIGALAAFNVLRVQQIEKQFNLQNTKTDKKLVAMELKEKAQELDLMSSELAVTGDSTIEDKYEAKRTEFLALINKVGENASNSEQRKWRALMTTASKEFADNFELVANVAHDPMLTEEDRTAKLKQRIRMSQAHKTYIFEMTDNFIRVFTEEATSAVRTSKSLLDQTIRVMNAAVAVVIGISVLVTLLFLRSFVGPIRKLQSAIDLAASGDLRVRIGLSSNDELGQVSRGFDDMAEQMAGMLTASWQVAAAMKELASTFENKAYETAFAGGEILKALDGISTGADMQASQAEYSVQGIQELDAHIEEIGLITDEMMKLGSDSQIQTRNGSESVEQLHGAARHTEKQLALMIESIEGLSSSSREIEKFSSTIEDISHQTNLLAVNATIEAAHAGASGRGFAIIADQVRALSDQAKESSRSIYELIHGLQKQMARVQKDLMDTGTSLQQQNAAIERTTASFGGIEQSAGQLAARMNSIHGKVKAAIAKNKHVVETIRVVSDVSDETAASVQEIHSSSMEQDKAIQYIAGQARIVNELAEQIFAQINKFRLRE